jgi:ATP-dependent RNA helicase SUPV3L1/SUV3
MPEIPAAGMATLAADADPRGAALAYRRAGRTWVRVDLADRLASHAHKVRSAGGDNPVDSELATSLGLGEESLVRLMADVGFARTGDSWRWRGRRGSRPAPRETGSNAFAELEKLRRK